MRLQTRVPDLHVIVVNGPEHYDHRFIEDLREPWMKFIRIRREMTPVEANRHAIGWLVQQDIDVFFKVDSDDLYLSNYIESVLALADEHQLVERQTWCLNLRDQLWINASSNGDAAMGKASFENGLGLTRREKRSGVSVGAPPTFVFNRDAADRILAGMQRTPYCDLRDDDVAMRQILTDEGVGIECLHTEKPVFGYLRHGGNTCSITRDTAKLHEPPKSTCQGKSAQRPFYHGLETQITNEIRRLCQNGNAIDDDVLERLLESYVSGQVRFSHSHGHVEECWFTRPGPTNFAGQVVSAIQRAIAMQSRNAYISLLPQSDWIAFSNFSKQYPPEYIEGEYVGLRISDADDSVVYHALSDRSGIRYSVEQAVAEFCELHRLTEAEANNRLELTLTKGTNAFLPLDSNQISSDSIEESPLSVVFANIDLGRRRTGIENAALLRARTFTQQLGIEPWFLTTKYDPEISDTMRFLVEQRLAPENLRVLNLYSFFQDDSVRGETDLNSMGSQGSTENTTSNVRRTKVSGSFDVRVTGAGDAKVAYEKWSDDGTRRLFTNYLASDGQHRRDTYGSSGRVSRMQWIEPRSRAIQAEIYLRNDGSTAISKRFEVANGNSRLVEILLHDVAGTITHRFSNEQQWIEYWITCICDSLPGVIAMFIDKNRTYFPAASKVASANHRIALIPVIHAVHTKDAFDVAKSKVNRNYNDVIQNGEACYRIVVATAKQADDMKQRFGLRNVVSVPTGASAPTVLPVFAMRDLTHIVYLGRYSEEKNHRLAFDVVRAVRQKIPSVRLTCYGSGGLQQELDELVRNSDLHDFIQVRGYTDDVADVYRNAGFSILTSQGEGFGLSIVESMSEGCPVAAFNVPYGPGELISHEETGVLSFYGETDRLAMSIVKRLQREQDHEAMCRNAWQSAQRFSESKVALQWKNFIETMLVYPT